MREGRVEKYLQRTVENDDDHKKIRKQNSTDVNGKIEFAGCAVVLKMYSSVRRNHKDIGKARFRM